MSSDAPAAPPQPPTDGRRRVSVGLAGIALIVGLGAGLLLGYVVFGEDEAGSAEAGVPTDTYVNLACDIAERLSETHLTDDDWGPLDEDTIYYEIPVLYGMLGTAAIQDEQYEHLGQLGTNSYTNLARLDADGFSETMNALVDDCAEL